MAGRHKPEPPRWDYVFWIVVDPWGEPFAQSFAGRRRDAIDKTVDLVGPLRSGQDWRELYRQGWRCVCVGLEPINVEDRPV